MDREEAVKRIKEIQKLYVFTPTINEALDLAIEALQGDFHCPKCGTIVRDGRQYHDLVYRGEAEKLQLSGETSTCKLKKDHDFLIKPDSDECKEQKSKLDFISRADAIAYIDRIFNSGLGKRKSLDYIRMYVSALPSVMLDIKTFCGVPIKEAIEVLENHKRSPSVTPTERAGEWISLFDGNEWFVHCSKCKTQHYEEDLLMGGSELPNFCPNCGAKMGSDTECGYCPTKRDGVLTIVSKGGDSEQYKKGFEDAKRAFLVEYARESENMRKRNAELEVRLNVQKAISAEERAGEWIDLDECSVCGKQAYDFIEGLVEGIEYLPNYCPNCGADMRGDKE